VIPASVRAVVHRRRAEEPVPGAVSLVMVSVARQIRQEERAGVSMVRPVADLVEVCPAVMEEHATTPANLIVIMPAVSTAVVPAVVEGERATPPQPRLRPAVLPLLNRIEIIVYETPLVFRGSVFRCVIIQLLLLNGHVPEIR
jgi:hypothetical protein